jgi:hypothetical protein
MTFREAGCVNTWASETFGGARLGDQRRTDRLVAMAARAAESPRGTVTGVFPSSAEREGAFRLLESGDVTSDAVRAAAMAAGAKRCRGERIVYVPVDGTTLTLTDYSGRRELGRVGTRFFARGLQVMSALAVDRKHAGQGSIPTMAADALTISSMLGCPRRVGESWSAVSSNCCRVGSAPHARNRGRHVDGDVTLARSVDVAPYAYLQGTDIGWSDERGNRTKDAPLKLSP